jgi:hypothetical protein
MPKETFWDSSTAVEGDDSTPVLTVSWHDKNCACGEGGVWLNSVPFDESGVDRLIRTLRKAKRKNF